MIIVILCEERDKKTGVKRTIVSHGIDPETLANVVLPSISPAELGATFNQTISEWVIE